MRTDDLITALAADTATERGVAQGLAVRLALALAVCAGMVGVVLGFRPDLAVSMITPVSLLRIVLTLALLGAGLWLALGLARPVGQVRLWPLALIAGVAVAALIWALVVTPAEGWGMAVQGKTMIWCLTSIPVLSILPVTVILLALRRGASTRPALSGALAGLAGAGGAAAAYALHCTEDSPLFYVTWYGLAILIVTALSAIIGRRVLRW